MITPGLSHFGAMLLFAALVSIGVACLLRRTAAQRMRHAAITFSLFVLVGIGIAWLMYPISR
jgi:hypothetical protein